MGEVIRRIIEKCVAKLTKQVILDPSCSLQVCAGHKSGSEAAVHAKNSLFQHVETDAVPAGGCVKRLQHIKPSRLPLYYQRSMSSYNCDQYLPRTSTTVCRGEQGVHFRGGTIQGDWQCACMPSVYSHSSLVYRGSDSSQKMLVCS